MSDAEENLHSCPRCQQIPQFYYARRTSAKEKKELHSIRCGLGCDGAEEATREQFQCGIGPKSELIPAWNLWVKRNTIDF